MLRIDWCTLGYREGTWTPVIALGHQDATTKVAGQDLTDNGNP
jgi:hypothetical protein